MYGLLIDAAISSILHFNAHQYYARLLVPDAMNIHNHWNQSVYDLWLIWIIDISLQNHY